MGELFIVVLKATVYSNLPHHREQLIEPQSVWHAIELDPLPTPRISDTPSGASIAALHARGIALLTRQATLYANAIAPGPSSNKSTLSLATPLSSSDKAFIASILTSGTSADRLSALVLVASSSPLHGTTYLTQLLTMCRKKSREESLRAVRALVDWCLGSSGALPNRKLRTFADQQKGLIAVLALQKGGQVETDVDKRLPGDDWLTIWAFEDWLKKWYVDLLRAIEVRRFPARLVQNLIRHLISCSIDVVARPHWHSFVGK